MTLPRIYLAGPEVFLPDASAIGQSKCRLLRSLGLAGCFPLDSSIDATLPPAEKARAIYRANREMLEDCEGALVNLTPFRGPSADPGTVFELGYLIARGKPVVAYSEDARDYRERVAGDDGMAVEAFGLADNLMLEESLHLAGLPLLRGSGQVTGAPGDYRDLALFERAARYLAVHLAPGTEGDGH